MKRIRHRFGFSLIEMVISIAIATFCLITLLGLLPAGLSSNRNSSRETQAANLATSLAADLHAAAPVDSSTPLFNIALNGSTPLYLHEDSSIAQAPTDASQGPVYRVAVTVTPPAGASHAASTAWIKISWDAVTDPTKTTPAGTYETVVSLNRN
jgi:uncharacterized protein (TIGR02598 family)